MSTSDGGASGFDAVVVTGPVEPEQEPGEAVQADDEEEAT